MDSLLRTRSDPFTVVEVAPGLELHLLATDRYRSVLGLWMVERGLDADRAARALLPDLLCRETRSCRGLAAMAARCEDLFGADLIGSASGLGARQVLSFGFECIDERYAGGRSLLREVSELLAEVLHDPPLERGRFDPQAFGQERENLVRAIDGLGDDKQVLAYRRMVEAMHAGTPFARHAWGTIEQARALSEDAVRQAWTDVRDAAPGRFFLVGALEPDEAVELVRRVAGPARREPLVPPDPPPGTSDAVVRHVTERQELAQSKLCMGFRLPVDDAQGALALLFAEVFGGGSSSRLFKRVREQESLAYGCGAAVQLDSGTLVVQAGIDASSVDRTVELVLEERTRLAQDGLEEGELEVARRALLRQLDGLGDAPRSLCAWRHAALAGGRSPVPAEARERLLAVLPAQLAGLAGQAQLDTVYLLEAQGG